MTTELFGLTLDGDIDPADVVVAAVVVVELLREDGKTYLRLVSSDLPVWRRLGMLQCIVVTDEAEAVRCFVNDEDSD
jgi:Mg2+/citrate symporter